MDIKEVEKLLSVTRANVRFYEKEGLITPKRKANNYRDYNDEDISKLKKILVLRKLGFTIQEIQDMQNGSLSLADATQDNIRRLQETIDELKGSLELSQDLEKANATFETIDQEHYWRIINEEEKRGTEFIDICKDYLRFELNNFDSMWKWVFFHDFKKSRKKYGVPIACGILLIICVLRGLANKYLWQGNFWEGFLYPFVISIIGSVIALPLYVLSRKSPKAAGVISSILLIIIIIFFIILALGIVALILNAVFDFGVEYNKKPL